MGSQHGQPMRGTTRLALAAIVVWLGGAQTAAAEPAFEPFQAGRQAISLAGGYAIGLPIGVAEGTDLEDVRMGAFLPSWSIGLTNSARPDHWYGGNLELLIEGAFLFNTEPSSGFAGGATATLRWNFVKPGRIVPYAEFGAGFGGLDFGLDKQADGFSFFLQAGLGARWFVRDRIALGGGWRFHHISNANTNLPNIGLDSSLFLASVTWYLR